MNTKPIEWDSSSYAWSLTKSDANKWLMNDIEKKRNQSIIYVSANKRYLFQHRMGENAT